jgi:hypothetical protein
MSLCFALWEPISGPTEWSLCYKIFTDWGGREALFNILLLTEWIIGLKLKQTKSINFNYWNLKGDAVTIMIVPDTDGNPATLLLHQTPALSALYSPPTPEIHNERRAVCSYFLSDSLVLVGTLVVVYQIFIRDFCVMSILWSTVAQKAFRHVGRWFQEDESLMNCK